MAYPRKATGVPAALRLRMDGLPADSAPPLRGVAGLRLAGTVAVALLAGWASLVCAGSYRPLGAGLLAGLSIAAPIGPMGLLCIRRTLAGGRRDGLVTGLGTATAHAVYAGCAAYGLAAVSGLWLEHGVWLRIAGGAFLAYLGLRTLRSDSLARPARSGAVRVAGSYLSALCLALTNPLTIASFLALFAGVDAAGKGENAAAGAGPAGGVLLVAGVFVGSCLWWSVLSSAAAVLDRSRLRWANRCSGLLLLGFALRTTLAGLWT